jgi:hypothetical protein
MDKNDVILELLKEVKAEICKLRENGCNKALMHEVVEKNQNELFSRVNILEQSKSASDAIGKDTRLMSVLLNPWPWLFASVAVFSPNAVAIIEVVKGVTK